MPLCGLNNIGQPSSNMGPSGWHLANIGNFGSQSLFWVFVDNAGQTLFSAEKFTDCRFTYFRNGERNEEFIDEICHSFMEKKVQITFGYYRGGDYYLGDDFDLGLWMRSYASYFGV